MQCVNVCFKHMHKSSSQLPDPKSHMKMCLSHEIKHVSCTTFTLQADLLAGPESCY